MAVMTIRNLDDDVRDKLRLRAALHGHSMEAEVRQILTEAVSTAERTLAEVLAEFRQRTGGLDFDLVVPPREPHTEPDVS